LIRVVRTPVCLDPDLLTWGQMHDSVHWGEKRMLVSVSEANTQICVVYIQIVICIIITVNTASGGDKEINSTNRCYKITSRRTISVALVIQNSGELERCV
jgi:hypothetical protein